MSPAGALIDIRPLRTNPPFRRLWMGSSVSAVGSQFTLVAMLYQVWELTGSPAAVGAVGLVQAVPMVVFGLIGGSLADSLDRRRLVLLTTSGQLLSTCLLAGQAIAELRSVTVLLALVSVQATCAALGAPARRTFAARLLPGEQIAAGVALSHLSFQVAMLVGPAVAGTVIAARGVGACYAIEGLAFVAALHGVRGLPPLPPLGEPGRPGIRAMVGGLRLIARRPVLRGALAVDVLATVLAMPVALFPVINAERFGGSAGTLGLFLSAMAVGGLVAVTTSGSLTRAARPGAVMLVTAGAWGAGLVGFGLARQLWLALGCLAVAGAADTLSVIARGVIVQLATPDSHRGRVSAVEHIIGVSGPDLGNFRGGLVGAATTATVAVVSGGVLCVVGVAGLAATNGPLRRFTARPAEPPSGDGVSGSLPRFGPPRKPAETVSAGG